MTCLKPLASLLLTHVMLFLWLKTEKLKFMLQLERDWTFVWNWLHDVEKTAVVLCVKTGHLLLCCRVYCVHICRPAEPRWLGVGVDVSRVREHAGLQRGEPDGTQRRRYSGWCFTARLRLRLVFNTPAHGTVGTTRPERRVSFDTDRCMLELMKCFPLAQLMCPTNNRHSAQTSCSVFCSTKWVGEWVRVLIPGALK